MTSKAQDAIEETQRLIEEIWENHKDKVRIQKHVDDLWENRREEVRGAENLASFVWAELDVTMGEARVIAQLLNQRDRDAAPPAIKQTKRGMYKE